MIRSPLDFLRKMEKKDKLYRIDEELERLASKYHDLEWQLNHVRIDINNLQQQRQELLK